MENIIGITELNLNELIEIEGGHDGIAYQIGHYAGKALLVTACVLCIASML
ncbi:MULTISPECIES: hypothetical protein [Flavobacterium]|uniref:hypothetical protein n=1 Tax=Flavobacterium TaxID=237 RepID=UPI000368AF13|nr:MULTISPECIES: hypothetical protein [Flavobacterium]URC12614.1 hypothetical protein M4I44_21400 [Flavobacterium sp. B183]